MTITYSNDRQDVPGAAQVPVVGRIVWVQARRTAYANGPLSSRDG